MLIAAVAVTGCSRDVDLQGATVSRQNRVINVAIGASAERPKLAYLKLLPCGGNEKQAYYVVLGDVRFGGVTEVQLTSSDLPKLPRPGHLCAQIYDRSQPLIRYASRVVRVAEQ
jgi:hypothetical protein